MSIFERGRILGRCSIAIFVCWAIVVAATLIFFIVYFVMAQRDPRLDLDINEPWYLRRADWNAMPDYGMDLLELPVPFVIIGHSAGDFCSERFACINDVLEIQSDHHRRGWYDIGPNFLVGGNGLVFEGRGANFLGVMVTSWNRNGISVMFLGNYVHDEPMVDQFTHVSLLLEELVRKGVLMEDYTVFGQCQVVPHTIPPGPNVMSNMDRFEHWNPANTSTCLRGSRR